MAVIQLILFDRVIAHTTGWTDGQAASWTVFSPIIDTLVLAAILGCMYTGVFLLLQFKRLWLRLLLSLLVVLLVWLLFYAIQIEIQHSISHFQGV